MFPCLQTNSRRDAYWDIVPVQPRQKMDRVARDLFKTVLFSSKRPAEQNIWSVQIVVKGNYMFTFLYLHSNEFTSRCLLGQSTYTTEETDEKCASGPLQKFLICLNGKLEQNIWLVKCRV